MSNNLAVIDGDSIIYYSCYNKIDQNKSIQEVFNCVDYYINSILDNTKSEYYTGFLTDGSFRYKIATQLPYKGNRSLLEKPKYFKVTKSYLEDYYSFTSLKNYEADDLCIMTHNTFNTTKEYNPIICSPDKDLKQVAGIFYDYKKGETIELNRQTGIKNLWKQVLTGDSGDNISGLKGIGEVKAEKLLSNYSMYAYPGVVLDKYLQVYGEYLGMKYFNETYQLVKMLDTLNGELYFPTIQIKKEQQVEKAEWMK